MGRCMPRILRVRATRTYKVIDNMYQYCGHLFYKSTFHSGTHTEVASVRNYVSLLRLRLPLRSLVILTMICQHLSASKVIALGAKHQMLLEVLPHVEAKISADVTQHESREAVDAEESRKVSRGRGRVPFFPHFVECHDCSFEGMHSWLKERSHAAITRARSNNVIITLSCL